MTKSGAGMTKDPACATTWNKAPVWIHGYFAIVNILMDGGRKNQV